MGLKVQYLLRGLFYAKETVEQHVFQLVTNKVAIVYATTAISVTLFRLGDDPYRARQKVAFLSRRPSAIGHSESALNGF